MSMLMSRLDINQGELLDLASKSSKSNQGRGRLNTKQIKAEVMPCLGRLDCLDVYKFHKLGMCERVVIPIVLRFLWSLHPAGPGPTPDPFLNKRSVEFASCQQGPRINLSRVPHAIYQPPTNSIMTSKRMDLTVDAIASLTSVAEPTIASSVAGIPDIDANAQDLLEDSTEESDYTGIEWSRLPQYHKPHHGFKGTPSWVWKYGYRLQKGKKIY
ncbi:hypothetical protein BJ546DRAFT_205393 [Cryomyces antarcticus]